MHYKGFKFSKTLTLERGGNLKLTASLSFPVFPSFPIALLNAFVTDPSDVLNWNMYPVELL